MSAAVTLAMGIILLAVSLLLDLPTIRWRSKTRLLLIAFVLVAVAVTMTVSTALVVDPGPLQIWPLGPLPETL